MKHLVLLGALLCYSTVNATNYKPTPPVETVSSSMSSAEKKVRSATVKVVVPGGGHGTGALIQYKDVQLIITAQHVADRIVGTNYLAVKGNESILATLIYSNKNHDIAILYPTAPLRGATAIKYEPVKDYDVGTDIIYSGYPSHHKIMSFNGRIIGYEEVTGVGTQLIVNTYGWFGCSGAVVFDTKGRVIGVLYGVDVEYYPNIQVNENMIWVSPIKSIDIKEAIKPFCRGTLRDYKACRQ